MGRTRRPHTAADIDAAIRQLEEERQRAILVEDQRRGELLRGYLVGKHGDAIRTALGRVVGPRDAYLFGLDGARKAETAPADQRRAERVAQQQSASE